MATVRSAEMQWEGPMEQAPKIRLLMAQAGFTNPAIQYTPEELLDMYTTPGRLKHTMVANGSRPDVPSLMRHAHPQDFLRGIRPVKSQDRGLYPHWR